MVIGMRSKDFIKSIILLLLVLMSIILTYKTWNFSPNLTTDIKSENDSDKETKARHIGNPKDHATNQVITPYQIVHSNKDETKGLIATHDNIDAIIKPLRNKTVLKSDQMHSNHNLIIPDLSNNFLVLDFSYDMPLSTYLGRVLNIKAKVPKNFKFNRLLIDNYNNGKIKLYAISEDRHDVVRMRTNIKDQQINNKLKEKHKEMQPYTEIITNKDSVDKATHIFAPSKPKNLKTYHTIYKNIGVESMNSILFDESVVVRSSNSGNTTYNNNTGVATYNDNNQKYRYTNLKENQDRIKNMKTTIPSTVDFINKHGGFTDDFRLFSTDNKKGDLTYQMFIKGRPTFSNDNLNSIDISWSKRGLFSYARTLIKANVTIDSGADEVNLPGAEKVRSELANNHDINFEKVTDMTIGYKMESQLDSDNETQSNSEFKPQWYVEYDGKWRAYNDGRLE